MLSNMRRGIRGREYGDRRNIHQFLIHSSRRKRGKGGATPFWGIAERPGQPPLLDMSIWQSRWTLEEWRAFLAARSLPEQLNALRRCTHTGRPLGEPEFVSALEQQMLRTLAPRKGGRPKKPEPDVRQLSFSSVA